jgi:hypothetical protein
MGNTDNINKYELKTHALSERLSQIVTEYENRVADLRVEFTLEVSARDERIAELEARIDQATEQDIQTDEA